MRRARYLARVASELVHYGAADRHYLLVLAVLVASVLLALVFAVNAAAPVALYPFA